MYKIRFPDHLGAAIAAALLVFCEPAQSRDREEGSVAVEAETVAFAPFLPGTTRFGKLDWRGGLVLSSASRKFGGYSGLILSQNGTELIAVSDHGWWFKATVGYDDDRISALTGATTARLLGPNGRVITNNHARDAEGIAAYNAKGAKGLLLVALERRERILLYDFGRNGFRARPQTIALPKAIRQARFNQELEAIGRFGTGTRLSGTIIALSERFLDGNGDIRGWLIGSRHAGPISIKRSYNYDITDLAILPDGDVLVLERRLNALKLAGMRIRRISHEDIKPGATLDADILLEANQPLKNVDNMEGITVHRSPAGELRITIISDDNFNPLQRTLLLQFALPEALQD